MNFHALVSSAHQRTKRTGRNKRKWISSDGCDQQSIVATFEIARFVAESKQWRASDAWKRKKISQRQYNMTREYVTCTFVMHKLPQIDLLSCNLMILFDSILYLIIILRNLRNNASPAHRPSLPSRDILLKGYWTIGWGGWGVSRFLLT